MGSSDELDDYDAELELTLRKEYADVFKIFKYCVVTDEATYLCNSLNIDCSPTPNFVLFDVKLDDVWVWDRHRPTRIIPSVQIYTQGDITVEQLRGDGDELTEALPKAVVEQLSKQMESLTDDSDNTDEGDENRENSSGSGV